MSKFDPVRAMSEVRREFGEHGGVCPSVARSSTFTVLDPGIMPDIFDGLRGPHKGGCFLYSRHFNPTVDVLNRYLAAMEGTEGAVSTASGMSAIACALLQLCRSGDHIVASRTVYGGTHALLSTMLPSMGITTTFVDPRDPAGFRAAATPATRVFYTESMGNPTLKMADVPAISAIARELGVATVVDNTFTPLMISPARLGADVVVYSLTKFVNGASDLLAGAICCSQDMVYRLKDLHNGRVMLLGPTMDPRTAFDILQRLPHLAVRMKEHGRRAMTLASALADQGTAVVYPGLASHPQHPLLKTLVNPGYGHGGMFTLDCGTREKAEQLMAHLQNEVSFGFIAVSLGYFDTLMSCSGSSTSSEIPPEDQAAMGLSPGLLRISVGLTGRLRDRVDQLLSAVKKVGVAGA